MVYEVLKQLHIPFYHRWIIHGKEVDFLIGNIIIELDGHDQDAMRNNFLASKGYIPIHLNNRVSEDRTSLTQLITQLCLPTTSHLQI